MEGSKLTAKQACFVDEYLIDLNATQAAIRAGYSKKTAGQIGEKLLKKVEIHQALTERRKEREVRTGIAADHTLIEAARIALFDPRKLFNDDGTTKPITELGDDAAAAIAGVKVRRVMGEAGEECAIIEYKFWDKNSALEKLFKHHGLYERDNRQRNLLQDLLDSLSGNVIGVSSTGNDDEGG